jgi:thioredoxin reductase (NADPH)
VCVVGGANSAGQGALFFSRYAKTVTMLVRAGDLRAAMSQYLVDRIQATPNIVVRTGVEIAAAKGDGHLEQVSIRPRGTQSEEWLQTSALFIFIGVAPRTDAMADFVCLDDKGFVITGVDLRAARTGWILERDPYLFETNVPGVFAVGDARAGASRRVAAAVGEGSAAIFSVHQYLRSV